MEKHTGHVLVIDDDKGIRGSLTDLLEDHEYDVRVANDGAAGLALLRKGFRPCVILLDIAMPGMDGWDFRAAQLREPAWASIPVVVMSAAGFSVPTIRTQFGDVDVLPKPVLIEDVLSLVSQACGRHG